MAIDANGNAHDNFIWGNDERDVINGGGGMDWPRSLAASDFLL
jgi:hypothetical protein